MAFKTVTASASTITQNMSSATPTVTFTPALSYGDVLADRVNVLNSTLTTAGFLNSSTTSATVFPGSHVRHPGVFTAGTPVEGSASNPTNDSNS